MADSDSDDDQTFSKAYREDESNLLISSKEADFRTFLCDSGASEEVRGVPLSDSHHQLAALALARRHIFTRID